MRHKLKILFLALAILVMPALSTAEELLSVKAEGLAPRAGDEAEAKRVAIDSALKNAVTEALSSLALKEGIKTSSIPQDVTSEPRNFVLNYKVLSEGWITHMDTSGISVNLPEGTGGEGPQSLEIYHIWVEAAIDGARLRGELGKLTAAGSVSPVRISLSGISDYNSFSSVVTALKRITAIKDLSYGSFYRGNIILYAQASVEIAALTERVAREVGDGFIVLSGGPAALVIKASPRPTIE